ncbi:MAG: hypothetical protein SGJ24_08695 [Chloroflexota bacterium]|nr:hypothetical protein [Chloroflexota bacterium]
MTKSRQSNAVPSDAATARALHVLRHDSCLSSVQQADARARLLTRAAQQSIHPAHVGMIARLCAWLLAPPFRADGRFEFTRRPASRLGFNVPHHYNLDRFCSLQLIGLQA